MSTTLKRRIYEICKKSCRRFSLKGSEFHGFDLTLNTEAKEAANKKGKPHFFESFLKMWLFSVFCFRQVPS